MLVLLLLLFVGLRMLSISPLALGDALDISTSMGAKIACSGKYVSGLSEQQIKADLAAYSQANNLLDISYQNNSVSTDFWGLSQAKATFRQGLGCTLVYAESELDLDSLTVPSVSESSALWPAGESINSIQPMAQKLLDQILLEDNQQGLDTRALVVVKNGNIVAESYAAGFTQSTPLLGWSMGKSLTSILFGNLVLNNKISVADDHLFSQWNDQARQAITLESLLHMSSGLAFDENYMPGTDATRMLFLEPSASRIPLSQPVEHPVGAHFSYSSGSSNILMRLAANTLGGPQALIDYFYQQIAQPLGLANTIFEVDPGGVFVGSSYILASARDWARMGLLMVKDGQINQQTVLSPEWVAAAQQANVSDNDPRYGYQFWLNSGSDTLRWPELPTDTYAMLGSKKQRVMMIPSHNTVIVRLGWSGSYPDDKNFSRVLAALAN